MAVSWDFPYSSRRAPVLADNIVATSQPLAAAAGLRMLWNGGNAVDAAIATAAALTVVEPTSNGLGSDAFAQVWDGEQLYAVNGSGRSPRAWSFSHFANRQAMPKLGWDSVTVPGAVSLWAALAERFGSLPLTTLMGPAIEYAEQGFAVSPITARSWQRAEETYSGFEQFAAVFLPKGRAPRAGERFVCPEQAATLRAIAVSGGEAFYRGTVAERIAASAGAEGGLLAAEDLVAHRSEWVRPLALAYRDVVVHELPPNGQGIAALIALGILRNTPLASTLLDGVDFLHWQIEAMKMALEVTERHVAEPGSMRVTAEQLLDGQYLKDLAGKVDPTRASPPGPQIPTDFGTVYLTCADQNGMMVSLIQSNYMGFGSGVVVPGTGISMQNRGCGFSLQRGHPNQVDGNKRPFHTIIPAMVSRDGKPIVSFGVMGARMQAQGHVQMIVRMFDFRQNPQAASDAPRWCVMADGSVALEEGFDPAVVAALRDRGHNIDLDQPTSTFGGAQIIMRTDTGYVAASDHRKDGLAVGF